MVLRTGYLVVAQKLQESAMMHGDVVARLSDAIQDAHRGSGHWGAYVNHNGDGESGDVVYSCDGDLRKCSYEMSTANGRAVTNLDMDNSSNVVPVTDYQEEADDDDHYAHMAEAFKAGNIYTDLPLYERFISKGEREKADEGSFAGKGKSFPILKPSDVSAAVHAMGRAGPGNYGMAQLKANIIRIAKAKGWESELPKAWRNGGDDGDTKKESAKKSPDKLILREAAAATESMLSLREASATGGYDIKLIAPGAGASAYYPPEVLKRDGPKAFPAQTKVYLNHPVGEAAKESPGNRDVHRLAGVLTKAAEWKESHPKGQGLYSHVKVFADHAQLLDEKAPYLQMSIMANGSQAIESGRKIFKNGLPVLASLDVGESVDVVPQAGAGGLILTEAARPNQEVEMTEAEIKAIVQTAVKEAVAAVTAPVKTLESRALRGDATVTGMRALKAINFTDEQKQFVVEEALRGELPTKDGALDETKFGELVLAEAKRIAPLISGYRGVEGLGSSVSLLEDEPKSLKKQLKEAKRREELEKIEAKDAVAIYESLGLPKTAAEFAAEGRRA